MLCVYIFTSMVVLSVASNSFVQFMPISKLESGSELVYSNPSIWARNRIKEQCLLHCKLDEECEVTTFNATSKGCNFYRDVAISLRNTDTKDVITGWWKVKSCPPGWEQFEKSCYLFPNETRTWESASQHCAHVGGYLATVNSQREQNFITGTRLYQRDRLFVGGRRSKDGSFQWVNGESMEFTLWRKGEPNNRGGIEDCLVLGGSTEGLWNDTPCNLTITTVCEKAMFV
ncbi:CLC4E-like protein [Mya arenaria]|uniref:CLC4E-like protein n=1 Tax=Mya arenaria TaxID=6604 RepID=A0ABY7GJM3_MYAAR|nr:lactose-binding lectin l-2-like [Mya arenaria]WAR31631.1 CLC4E-like protein [Mya arenaria]